MRVSHPAEGLSTRAVDHVDWKKDQSTYRERNNRTREQAYNESYWQPGANAVL